MRAPLLFVVVLNWNRPAKTLRCLEALGRSSYPNLETLVVDNGSRDDSVARIGEAYPAVPVLRLAENVGYAAGNNAGIGAALRRGACYIVLLNNDAYVEPGTLAALAAAASEGVGAVGGKVRLASDPARLWAAGPAFGPGAFPLDDGRYDAPREVTYVAGCCILLSRPALEAVGLLDPAFFAYYEEYDWCLRARAAGYSIRYAPAATLAHDVGATAAPGSPLVAYLMTRNRLRMLERRGAIPADWRRLKGAAIVWLLEAERALRGKGRAGRLRAVTRGALDYLCGRFGPPPAHLLAGLARPWESPEYG